MAHSKIKLISDIQSDLLPYNRIITIQQALKEGEMQYIDLMLEIMIDEVATWEENIYNDTFFVKLNEALDWYKAAKANYE